MNRESNAVDFDDVFAYERAIGERIDARAFSSLATRRIITVENVAFTVKGNMLTITVKLNAKRTPSASGKSEVIATTKGNVTIPGTDDVKCGLNVYVSSK